MGQQTEEATYYPQIFNSPSEFHAKGIILTPEGSQPTNERWIKETPYLIDLILESVKLDENSLVLDYGCGIGRLAKELIDRTNCKVIGVDISLNMLEYAYAYVKSENFTGMSLKVFNHLVLNCPDFKFDLALAVWVLQHCLEPDDAVGPINACLKTGAKFFVVNDLTRKVPTLERGWADDGLDIQEVIKEENCFKELKKGQLDPKIVPKELHENCFWGVYQAT
jgi:ubiquinone/menaquinone biosynthesis C-methylase UbiE